MKIKLIFPSVTELFKEIKKIVGDLDHVNEERSKGNVQPTAMVVDILKQYIQSSPKESIVSKVSSIMMLLGEEDCNTELLQGVEDAIRARQEIEIREGHTHVAKQLSRQSLQALIEDSEHINRFKKSGHH